MLGRSALPFTSQASASFLSSAVLYIARAQACHYCIRTVVALLLLPRPRIVSQHATFASSHAALLSSCCPCRRIASLLHNVLVLRHPGVAHCAQSTLLPSRALPPGFSPLCCICLCVPYAFLNDLLASTALFCTQPFPFSSCTMLALLRLCTHCSLTSSGSSTLSRPPTDKRVCLSLPAMLGDEPPCCQSLSPCLKPSFSQREW